MNSVSQNQSGVASGISNAVARTAGLLAIAIFGIVMLHTFNATLDQQLKNIRIAPDVRELLDEQRVKLAGIQLPSNLDSKTIREVRHAVASSFVSSFRLIMILSTGLAIVSAVAAWFLIEDKKIKLRKT